MNYRRPYGEGIEKLPITVQLFTASCEIWFSADADHPQARRQ